MKTMKRPRRKPLQVIIDERNEWLLQRAVFKGNMTKAIALLSEGYSPMDKILENRATLLHHASSYSMARILLLFDANVNAKDRSGATPLHYAVRQNLSLELIRGLVLHGAEVDAMDADGKTPLMLAVECGCIRATITELVLSGADINKSNYDSNNLWNSPFKLAMKEKRNFSICKFFIKYLILAEKVNVEDISTDFCYFDCEEQEILYSLKNVCLSEIEHMRSIMLTPKYSFYHMVRGEYGEISEYLVKKSLSLNIIVSKYPVYGDIIRSLTLRREYLLKVFCKLHLIEFGHSHTIILDSECMYKVGMFLLDGDIFKYIRALISRGINKSESS